MAKRYLNPDSPRLLALLAALVALGPLSVDMYLPAMPVMMRALDTDISQMHLTLSVYLTGFALFHLVCGPLADRFGRKPILIGGTLIFVAACIGCAQSDSIDELLVYRFLQGIGACVGPTLARTVTRDIFGPRRAARALSLIAMLMALGPAVAPTLGGFLLLVLPWPVIFLFLAVYGVLMILLIHIFLAESLPKKQSLHPLSIARNYAQLIADPSFVSVTVASALVYCGLLAYLSSSSFVYIEMLGVPVQYFGFIFVSTVAGYMAGSAISARLASRWDSQRTMLVGSVICVATSTTMWLGNLAMPTNIWVLILPMTFYAIGMGLVLPHAMAIAMAPFPQIAGTASALLGFLQMGFSAVATALVGALLVDTPQPMLVAMAGFTLAGALITTRVYRRANTEPDPV